MALLDMPNLEISKSKSTLVGFGGLGNGSIRKYSAGITIPDTKSNIFDVDDKDNK